MNRLQIIATVILSAGVWVLAAAPEAPVAAPSDQDASKTRDETVRQRALLRRENYKAIESDSVDDDLERAIRRLERVRLTPKKVVVESPTSQSASVKASRSSGTITQPNTSARTVVIPTPGKVKVSPLDKIRSLPAGSIPNPVALADALYLADRIEAAVTFYEKGLEGRVDVPTRAWILFQLGNCHKYSDPQAARGYYKRLLSEHSTSIWNPTAIVSDRLISWRLTNKPAELLKTISIMTEKRK